MIQRTMLEDGNALLHVPTYVVIPHFTHVERGRPSAPRILVSLPGWQQAHGPKAGKVDPVVIDHAGMFFTPQGYSFSS